MKTWTRTFGAALALTLSTACTVTVGSGVDDSDDLDFTDKTEDPETSEGESSSASTTSGEGSDTGETSAPSTGGGNSSEEMSSSTSASSTSEPASSSSSSSETTTTGPGPVPIACSGEPAEGSCEECLENYCEAEWQACCATDGCVSTWTGLYSCMVNYPTEDPLGDFDACAESVSDSNDQFDLPDEVLALTSCVNQEFMGDTNTDEGRLPGDGTCTLACYNHPTLFPME